MLYGDDFAKKFGEGVDCDGAEMGADSCDGFHFFIPGRDGNYFCDANRFILGVVTGE